jgi:outer membrane protein OmpA-like peptidoglycan-associated protein
MSTLSTSIDELVTPRLIERLSAQSGVPGTKVRTGISGAVASILDGLATRAHDPRAMGRVAELVSSAPTTEQPEQLLDDETAMQRSSNRLLDVVGGGDAQSFASKIGHYAGVGGAAATGIVAAAAAVVLGAFRKLGRALGGLDARALSTTLIDEEREIHAAVPTAMLGGGASRVAAAAGEPVVAGAGPTLRERAAVDGTVRRAGPIEPRGIAAPRGRWWILPVLLIAIVIIAIALWGGHSNRHMGTRAVPPSAPAATTPAPTTPAPNVAPQPAQPAQQSAAALGFAAGTPEAQLVDELKTPGAPNTNQWIALDVGFDADSAALHPDAGGQLANIAKALAAYPNARVQVAGFTDPQGSPDTDQTLSQARADAVRQELIARGVDGSRIDSKGFGESSPLGSNAAADHYAAIEVISP